ncbi:MAG: sigma factor-like helix-turn-helix DNA-binding protein, partial [Eubacteriales bacterium]|nr:sigma factor-like helix-turn-helix DNA-binding protein [Eubacteriales bacterium]
DDYNFETDEEYQNLRRSIAQMSAVYRDIIVMHYYDNLSCKAISQSLGLPEGTVTYRLSLARTKLKERCNQMNETALKPAQLKIRIHGEGNYNGEDRPFPWQYIDDALSQNILWYSYREPKTVEELSSLTGVPAFYIEDRIDNLVKREAVIQPTKKTVQANFLIFDKEINAYAPAHSGDFAAAVSEDFYRLSLQLADEMLSSGLQISNRSIGEFQCLLSVMLLDKFVPDYRPTEYKRFETRYDGGRWEYTGFYNDGSCGGNVGISMEKSMNNFENSKLAHYSYHFAPFAYRKMMFDHEIDICQNVLQGHGLSEAQKETAARLIANGYLAKDELGKAVCAIPVFTKEQYDLFLASVKTIFADFLPFYSEEVKKYLDGYMKLFPKHLKEATERNGFHVFVALFKAVAADWLRSRKIKIPNGAVCDALIMM